MPSIPDDKLDDLSRRLNSHYGVDRDPLTEAQIRNSRHAYYGPVSYIDDKIGQLLIRFAARRITRHYVKQIQSKKYLISIKTVIIIIYLFGSSLIYVFILIG